MKNSVFGLFAGFVLAANVSAQTSVLTSVTVVASDPLATEPPGVVNFVDTGAFTISRQGPTNLPLHVFFTLTGTASNSVDYMKIESPVIIPEGSRFARVTVVPLPDDLLEGEERVILRIAPSPLAEPGAGYILPTNSLGAVVTIRDYPQQPTNSPPSVQISHPVAGATFQAPAGIDIIADTVDHDGWVPKVEFFANGAKIGESLLNFVVAPPDGTPISHEFTWKDVGVGDYQLTARATDDEGAVRTSLPVRIFVIDSNAPPRTVVSIVATDAEGSEIPEVPPDMERPQLIDPAIFTVSRTGILSNSLTVYYLIAGRASNGVDYVEIPRQVEIPAGARSALIEINVIDDLLVEGTENVVIQLVPPPCIELIWPPPPECYVVGGPIPGDQRVLGFDDLSTGDEHEAVPSGYGGLDWHNFRVINGQVRPDNEGYHTGVVSPPNVIFNGAGDAASIHGRNGSAFDLGSAYLTSALNLDDEMKVQVLGMRGGIVLYDNTFTINRVAPTLAQFNYRGIDQARFIPLPARQFVIDNLTVGVGGPGRAEAWIIDNDTAPSNRPPVVTWIQPPDGSAFPAGSTILMRARATDSDGTVSFVDFFANTTRLARVSFGSSNVYSFAWSNAPAGNFRLRAEAVDNAGGRGISDSVQIVVGGGTNVPPRNVVSIVATDPEGTEIPEVPPGMGMPQLIDPAIFSVRRSGPVSNDLVVYYAIGGTASNGVDYVEIPHEIKIPAGATSADIEISVIDDTLAEGTENVVLRILPPPCITLIWPPPPECYVIGIPGLAEARILDNDLTPSNRPPVVSIVVPTNGAVFKAPTNIHIIAQAFDLDGYVHTVEFFEGTNSLGITTNNPLAMNAINPFQINWTDVPPGQYMLTALATDDKGATSRSRSIWITVLRDPIDQTVVNIRAVDPEAAEQDPRLDSLPNNALLRVTRTGPTDFDLPVYYRVDGTAQNGVDYVELKGQVTIPTGSESADILIEAIDDKLAERTESVNVTLVPPVCIAIWPPPKECYLVGFASRATAFILDDEPFETNLPPHVEITQPVSGASFRAPADIHIVAKTVDRDGYVGKVEFFANNHKIGEASKQFLIPPPDGEPIEYDFDWKDVQPGYYALTARAIDDNGASGFSMPVRISVIGTNPPPPTNVAVVTVYAIDGYASEGGIILTNDPRMLLPYNTNGTIRNVAVFEVRRSGGNADLPLRVFYEMHGTASEGVDYLDLPEIVEIPAGQRAARVVIVPVDDQLKEVLESVVLCLRPSPLLSILPDYVIGRPGSAAAVIADNDAPRLTSVCLRDGVFHWASPATSDQCYRIECSTDLVNWTSLNTVRATEGTAYYTDAESLAHDRRFYRAVAVPCPAE